MPLSGLRRGIFALLRPSVDKDGPPSMNELPTLETAMLWASDDICLSVDLTDYVHSSDTFKMTALELRGVACEDTA